MELSHLEHFLDSYDEILTPVSNLCSLLITACAVIVGRTLLFPTNGVTAVSSPFRLLLPLFAVVLLAALSILVTLMAHGSIANFYSAMYTGEAASECARTTKDPIAYFQDCTRPNLAFLVRLSYVLAGSALLFFCSWAGYRAWR